MAVAPKERPRIRGQMIEDRAPLAVPIGAQMARHQAVILEDRDHLVGGAHPERLTNERVGSRVQHVLELDVTIPMQDQLGARTRASGTVSGNARKSGRSSSKTARGRSRVVPWMR